MPPSCQENKAGPHSKVGGGGRDERRGKKIDVIKRGPGKSVSNLYTKGHYTDKKRKRRGS